MPTRERSEQSRFGRPAARSRSGTGAALLLLLLALLNGCAPVLGVRTSRFQAKQAGVTTVLGSPAKFLSPQGVALLQDGTIYVADTGNHVIRKIDGRGRVTTLAGLAANPGYADGTGAAARFSTPTSLAVGPDGTIYVADSNNHAIRTVSPGGVVKTFAGSPNSGYLDAVGTAAQFDTPAGVAVGSNGTVYVADSSNHVVRKITAARVVSTLAGLANNPGSSDAPGAAQFTFPSGVALAPNGTLYVADSGNHRIRSVAAGGAVATVAGSTAGYTDGILGNARFSAPNGVAVFGGKIYIADTGNHAVRVLDPISATVASLVGTQGFGFLDGPGTTFAQSNEPYGVAVDRNGTVFVAEAGNHAIRKISAGGLVGMVAGTGQPGGYLDGPAGLIAPAALDADAHGNLYVADEGTRKIHKISPAGEVTVVAGANGEFGRPSGVAIFGNTLYVTDSDMPLGDMVYKISAGQMTLLDTTWFFDTPLGIDTDKHGNLYVMDRGNATVIRINLISSPGPVLDALELPTTPWSVGVLTNVVLNASGHLFVTDPDHYRVIKVSPDGVAADFAGTPFTQGTARGPLGTGELFDPVGMATLDNTLYVSEPTGHLIRKVLADGFVLILAGTAGQGTVDGPVDVARFDGPSAMASNGSDSLFVIDDNTNAIRRITFE